MKIIVHNGSIRSGWKLLLLVVVLLSFSSSAHANALHGAGLGGLGGALTGSLSGPAKNQLQNAVIGGAIGAALGYAIGNDMEKTPATATVTVLETQSSRTSSPLGYAIGNDMEKTPATATVTVLETQSSRTSSQWVDPDTGVVITYKPQPARLEDGLVCREITLKGRIDGNTETILAKACRHHDGRWNIVEQQVVHTPEVVIYQNPAPRIVYRSVPVLVVQPKRQHYWGQRSWQHSHHNQRHSRHSQRHGRHSQRRSHHNQRHR